MISVAGQMMSPCEEENRAALRKVRAIGYHARLGFGGYGISAMTDEDKAPAPAPKAPTRKKEPASREDRLGEALRANLRRRKAAAKDRKKD